MVENELELTLRDKHKVDGHDIGSGKMNIFISTSDPDETFELARKALSDNDLKIITVAFRDIMDDNYSVLWPENYSGEFEIKQA